VAAVPPALGADEAYELAAGYPAPGRDRFYGPVGDAALGSGLILTNIEYPTYLIEEERFGVLRGPVMVLTHECDLDPENERILNDNALICPIIPLDALVEALNQAVDYDEAKRFVSNVSARYVNRLLYLPPIPDLIPLGGYLYLNLLTNTHVSKLQAEDVAQPCMLSVDGFRELDFALERHLRRPKADRVPFEIDPADQDAQ
jgi:hypothetical protein